jgi:wyosine [tRNA(Phe)-imidazoG37] synthetase (radical SAM superfamily)
VSDERARLAPAWKRHERRWRDNRLVYAVVSRRSGGVSVGINLNPDKACNFDCIYCQVDRTIPPAVRRVDLRVLAHELDLVLEAERDGSLYEAPPFALLSPEQRGIRDLAFSGDGEPTTFPRLREAFEIAAERRLGFGLRAAKLVLITDAAYLERPAVREALAVLDRNHGEIWAKLDAGTEEYFRQVDRPNVTFRVVLEGILSAARARPIVIQSLFLRLRGAPPPESEIDAYCGRLQQVLARGGRLSRIQIYTLARKPAEPFAGLLGDAELDAIAARVKARITVPIEVHYGVEP